MISTVKYLYDTDDEDNIVDVTSPTAIKVIMNNVVMQVPLDPANTDYAEIMELVEAGELTIAPADSEGS